MKRAPLIIAGCALATSACFVSPNDIKTDGHIDNPTPDVGQQTRLAFSDGQKIGEPLAPLMTGTSVRVFWYSTSGVQIAGEAHVTTADASIATAEVDTLDSVSGRVLVHGISSGTTQLLIEDGNGKLVDQIDFEVHDASTLLLRDVDNQTPGYITSLYVPPCGAGDVVVTATDSAGTVLVGDVTFAGELTRKDPSLSVRQDGARFDLFAGCNATIPSTTFVISGGGAAVKLAVSIAE